MIHGVTASQLLGLGGGLTGTVMDFVNGQYVVDSVEYALSSLFGDGAEGTVDFGAVVAGRGWLSTYDDINRPSAIGPLKAKLLQPHSAVIEWEDLEEFYEGLFLFVDGGVDYVIVRQGAGEVLEIAGWGVESVSSDYRYFGVNRMGLTLGADNNSRIAFNGGAASDPIASPDHPRLDYDEIYPFGAEVNYGPVDGFVRRLTVLDVLSAAELSARTALDTPDMITDLTVSSVTSTTATLAFTEIPAATSYEYWSGPTASSPSVSDFDWLALAGNKIVTGLTPNTGYRFYVRGVNDDGPGGADISATATTNP